MHEPSTEPGSKSRDQLSEAKRALLERRLRGESFHPAGASPTLERRSVESPPLSFAQQRLWFLDQFAPGNPFYSESTAVRLSFDLDADVLERALNEIVRRHEVLRTRFPSRHGRPVQVIDEHADVVHRLARTDLRSLGPGPAESDALRLAAEEARRPFDLAHGPLLRSHLVRVADQEFLLLLAMHHIVCDGWSMEVFFGELSLLYDAFSGGQESPLPELPIQYADFSVWQRNWLQGPVYDNQLLYWKDQLNGLSSLELPLDRPRPVVPTFEGASEEISFSGARTESLRRLSQHQGATLFMTMLAGFVAVLHRYSSQDDIAVGCPVANRTREETEGLIGLFVNTLVVRTDCSDDPSFAELLARVRETALDAFTHQDLPFEKLVEELQPERDPAKNPLFQVTFQLFSGVSRAGSSVDSDTAFAFDVKLGAAKFDLRFDLGETANGLSGQIEYSTDLFDVETIRRLITHLHRAYDAVVVTPDVRLSQLPLLNEEERHELLRVNSDTAVAFKERSSVIEWFEATAAAHEGAIAATDGDQRLTYGELNAAAGALAGRLAALGVGRERLVAVCATRSFALIVSELAAWKVGAAFVPVDPLYPRERIAFMLRDSGAAVVLTSNHDRGVVEGLGVQVLNAADSDGDNGRRSGQGAGPGCSVGDRVQPDDLAYVIYTSGSGGRPKGVAVPHRGLLNLIAWHQHTYGVSPEDRASVLASPAFDASVWEIWPYLTAGASIHVVDDRTRDDLSGLLQWCADRRITMSFVPTPLAERLVDEPFPPGLVLRALLTGGDRLQRAPSSRLPFRFVNHYGPTEGSVVATAAPVEAGHHRVPPIGRPIANTRVYVVDRWGQLVPRGITGELWIAGAGLARGYWGHASTGTAGFSVSAWGERVYQTGDRVRWRGDALEFLGRTDQQVKVRGYRVELGEIEAVIGAVPEVSACVVVAREGRGGVELVGYVTPRDHAQPESEAGAASVGEVREVFDQVYRGRHSADPTFETVGWTSSATGEALSATEMREWLAETLARLRPLGAQRVLEVGCGTGLLLFALAEAMTEYVGTDFSAEALAHVRAQVAAAGLHGVRLEERTAADWDGMPAEHFDLVILNSVVQYFPDQAYLRAVVAAAARVVRPGGHIFIGDVRHLGLHEAYAAWVEHERATPDDSPDVVVARVRERLLGETELLLAPEYFAKLREAVPSLTSGDVQAKFGGHWNELTRFRYDVLLQIGGDPPANPPLTWRPWQGQTAYQLADVAQGQTVGWRGVATARLAGPVGLARALHEKAPASGRPPAAPAAAEPEAVRAAGATVCVRYGQAEDGFDLLVSAGGPVWWLEPLPAVPAPWNALASNPSQGKARRAIVPRVRAAAAAQLPEWMVPDAWVVLERLPLTAHGKVDRRSLPAPDHGQRDRVILAPRTPLEAALAQIWREVLGHPRIGMTENFFHLGGHSLLATQLLSRVRDTFQVPLPLSALFEAPTIAEQAQSVIACARGLDQNGESRVHRIAELLVALDGLSDEDVQAELARRRSALPTDASV